MTRSCYLNYFTVFINLGYYVCVIPFKFKYYEKGRVSFHKYLPQQLMCALMQMMILYQAVMNFVNAPWAISDSKPPFKYIWFGEVSVTPFTLTTLFYTFWFKQNLFIVLIDGLQQLGFQIETPQKYRKTKMIGFGVQFIALTMFVMERFVKLFGVDGEFEEIFRFLNKEATDIYWFIGAREPDPQTCLVPIIIHVIVSIPMAFAMLNLNGIATLSALCFKHIMTDFINFCKSSNNQDMNMVLQHYYQVKDLIRVTNDIFGPVLFIAVILFLPFYPAWAGVLLSNWSTLEIVFKYGMSFAVFTYSSALILACMWGSDINSKAGEFYGWISTRLNLNAGFLGTTYLPSLHMDMSSNQIALKCGGVYPITYGFCGSMLGMFLTYTIIIIQFSPEKVTL